MEIKILEGIISDINRQYIKYQLLSNDNLRLETYTIQSIINENVDKVDILNQYLVKIFAIVKETARRFSLGCITVTANDNDYKLAKIYDFVTIDGEYAVYNNEWFAGGNKSKWNMIHYDEQLMAGILLHYGYITQMATGEGKTLVATLPAFLNALTHKGVHVMTVNDYLSKRDCETTRPIYAFYGLSVDCIEYYPTHSSQRIHAYNADITFGTNSSFAFDYLYDHLSKRSKDCVQRGHNFCVIDEADSILIDNADEPHIISGGNPINMGDEYKIKKNIIEELLQKDGSNLYLVDILKHKAWFTDEGKKWLAEKCELNDLYTIDFPKRNELKYLKEEERQEIIYKMNTQNILQQLLFAYTLYVKDIDYVVSNNKIIIVDQHTGRLKEDSRWEHGLHTAIEVKENIKIYPDRKPVAAISLKNYFKLYSRICGMTGTALSVSEEILHVYGLKTYVIPTHAKLIRNDFPLRVFRNKKIKDDAIIEEIQSYNKKGRPVLVGCLSIKRAEDISKLLSDIGINHNLLTAKSLHKEAYLISQAGQVGQITVTTSLAGRGTDIKLSKESFNNGGLAVIGTDLFDSERVDGQLKGRAGRQGDPGSSLFFVSLEDNIIQNLNQTDNDDLNRLASMTDYNELSMNNIRDYVEIAQSNREMYFFELRKESNLKDDIIAPFRYVFYQERNNILYDKLSPDNLLYNWGVTDIDMEELNIHIHELYIKACAIFMRSQANNKISEEFNLPFSNNMHLFTVLFDINKAVHNYDYFAHEFKKQTILSSYDKSWGQFVQHMMQNLNKSEIDELPKLFNEMKIDIKRTVLSRLTKSTIPVGDDSNSSIKNNYMSEEKTKKNEYKQKTSSNAPCPCGSNKKFGECHGQNTHRKNRR